MTSKYIDALLPRLTIPSFSPVVIVTKALTEPKVNTGKTNSNAQLT
jgi:hypothetical protein